MQTKRRFWKPPPPRRAMARAAALALLLAAAACGEAEPEAAAPASDAAAARPSYAREYLFVGRHEDAPVAAVLSFRTRPDPGGAERRALGWLARGATGEAFLSERWHGPLPGSVWQILPRGPLRIAARGATDLEAVWYRRGDRALRLDMAAADAEWVRGTQARFRLLGGRLTLGAEPIPGTVLEVLRVRGDGTGGAAAGQRADKLLLTTDDSVHVVIAAAKGGEDAEERTFARGLIGGREWGRESVTMRWSEVRAVEQARRDVPARWEFEVPGGELRGEVRALGHHDVLGEEQGGRRAVEVYYTVQGWVELDGERHAVSGVARHAQG